MIVKNEEAMLKRTLPDLINNADEIIVVDTGSADNTIEYAKSCGAKVYTSPWINDFSAARNESIKYASGDWVLWIDADEYIKPEDICKLKGLLSQATEDAFSLNICEAKPGEFEAINSYKRCKIFRNNKGFHFERPINEQVADKDNKPISGATIEDIFVFHWGNHINPEHYKAKKIRNIPMMEKMLEEDPNYAEGHFLLAGCYSGIGKFNKAADEYEKAIEHSTSRTFIRDCVLEKGWSLYNAKDIKGAHGCAVKAINYDNDNISAYNLIALVLITIGDLAKAAEVLKHISLLVLNDKTNKNSPWQKGYLFPMLKGRLLEANGDKKLAFEEYQTAGNFDLTPFVKEKIEELKWA